MPTIWRRLRVKTTDEPSSSFAVELKKGKSKLFRSLKAFRAPRSRWFFALCVIAPALVASTAFAASSTVATDKRARQLQRMQKRLRVLSVRQRHVNDVDAVCRVQRLELA